MDNDWHEILISIGFSLLLFYRLIIVLGNWPLESIFGHDSEESVFFDNFSVPLSSSLDLT